MRRIYLLSCAVALPALAAVADAAESPRPAGPLTLEEVSTLPVNWGFSLSPSGRYLAWVQRIETTNAVVVADLQDDKKPPSVNSIADARVEWLYWVSDDRFVLAARFWVDKFSKPVPIAKAQRGERRTWSVLRLFGADREGKALKVLFADNREALSNLELGRIVSVRHKLANHFVMPAWRAGTFDLFSVDTQTGASTRIAAGTRSTYWWYTDIDGNPAFRLDVSASRRFGFVYARTGPADAPPEALQWEKVHTIRLRHEDDDFTPNFYPLYPGPEADTYYISARPDGADTSGIYLYDYARQKYLKTIATEDGVDIERVMVDSRTLEYLGVEFYRERKITRFADPVHQAYFDAAARYFGDEVEVSFHGANAARDVWLLYTHGPRDPGSWHVYRLKDKYIREVAQRTPGVTSARLGPVKVLRYRARDGLSISGYLTVPPGHRLGDRPPLVMLPHGGPEARDWYKYDAFVQFLATHGYQVFQPNFRGSSGFGRKFAEAGYREWGAAMQDDLTDALRFLVAEGHADKDRACIVGSSYGGYAALAGATLTPDQYRCAVAIAGISNIRDWLKHRRRLLGADEGEWAHFKHMYGDPAADAARLDGRSPELLANTVTIPILLIHGTADSVVPLEQSEQMDEALREAGKNVRFVKVERMGHSPDYSERKQVYGPALEFLQQHLPVVPAAPPPPAP